MLLGNVAEGASTIVDYCCVWTHSDDISIHLSK